MAIGLIELIIILGIVLLVVVVGMMMAWFLNR
jgi:hypothetical protein